MICAFLLQETIENEINALKKLSYFIFVQKPSGSSTGPRCNICKKTFKSFLVLSYHKIR